MDRNQVKQQGRPNSNDKKKSIPANIKSIVFLKFSVRNFYSQVRCPSAQMAQKALAEVRIWVQEIELILHPDKTHTGDCSLAGQGIEFLGYRFKAGRRWVRKKSLKALKDRILAKTGRSRGDSVDPCAGEPHARFGGRCEHGSSRPLSALRTSAHWAVHGLKRKPAPWARCFKRNSFVKLLSGSFTLL
jgi:hypothetical protein